MALFNRCEHLRRLAVGRVQARLLVGDIRTASCTEVRESSAIRCSIYSATVTGEFRERVRVAGSDWTHCARRVKKPPSVREAISSRWWRWLVTQTSTESASLNHRPTHASAQSRSHPRRGTGATPQTQVAWSLETVPPSTQPRTQLRTEPRHSPYRRNRSCRMQALSTVMRTGSHATRSASLMEGRRSRRAFTRVVS